MISSAFWTKPAFRMPVTIAVSHYCTLPFCLCCVCRGKPLLHTAILFVLCVQGDVPAAAVPGEMPAPIPVSAAADGEEGMES